MADVWPGTLPSGFDEAGYSERSVDNTIISRVESGPVLVRKRFTAAPRAVTGVLTCSIAQRATLELFYQDHQGERFQWADPRGVQRFYLFVGGGPVFSSFQGGLYYKARLSLLEFTSEFGGG